MCNIRLLDFQRYQTCWQTYWGFSSLYSIGKRSSKWQNNIIVLLLPHLSWWRSLTSYQSVHGSRWALPSEEVVSWYLVIFILTAVGDDIHGYIPGCPHQRSSPWGSEGGGRQGMFISSSPTTDIQKRAIVQPRVYTLGTTNNRDLWQCSCASMCTL